MVRSDAPSSDYAVELPRRGQLSGVVQHWGQDKPKVVKAPVQLVEDGSALQVAENTPSARGQEVGIMYSFTLFIDLLYL